MYVCSSWGTLTFFYKNTLYKNTEARFAKQSWNTSGTCTASDEKLKTKLNVIFEMPQCDSLIEIFTTTQLPTFFWQTNSDEVIDKDQQSLLYFQKKLYATCSILNICKGSLFK